MNKIQTPNAHQQHHDRHDDPQSQTAQEPRRNPRIVIGGLDFFELLLEQEEQH